MQCRASARMADVPLLVATAMPKPRLCCGKCSRRLLAGGMLSGRVAAHHSSHFTIMRAIVRQSPAPSLLAGLLCLRDGDCWPSGGDWASSAQTTKAPAAKNDKQAPVAAKGEQAIVVLVNDDPVTAYQIDQRAAFLGLNSEVGPELKAKAEARWAEIIKDPKTNERFQAFLRRRMSRAARRRRRCRSSSSWVCTVHARADQA